MYFFCNHIPQFKFSHLFCIDLYAEVFGRAPVIDELVMNIHLKIENEIKLQQQMFKLLGCLEMVMTTTSLHQN